MTTPALPISSTPPRSLASQAARSALTTCLAWLIVLGAGATSAQSQDMPGLVGGILGGIMQEAQRQEARDAWRRVPPRELACLRRIFAKGGNDLNAVVQSGNIAPDDTRLSQLKGQCARFSQASLKLDYPCSVAGEDGSRTQTTCNQTFARQDAAEPARPITPDEALDAQLAGQRVVLADIETDTARQARLGQAEFARLAPELQALRRRVSGVPTASDAVRQQAGPIASQIDRALASRSLSASLLERLGADVTALEALAAGEAAKAAAIGRIRAAKAEAERRSGAETADHLRARLKALADEFAVLLEAPPAPPRPKAQPLEVGPSFDCEKAKRPIETLLCSTPELRRADLALYQPFYAMRHVAPDRQPEFRQDAIQFAKRVLAECRIPEQADAVPPRNAGRCVLKLYGEQQEAWRRLATELGPPQMREEVRRPVEDHLRLQDRLKQVQALSAEARLDGIYGSDTRRAITAFQTREGLAADGLMSEATAERLRRASDGSPMAEATADLARRQTLLAKLASLEARYGEYLAGLAAAERLAGFRTRSVAKIEALVTALEPVPESLRKEIPVELDRVLGKVRAIPYGASTPALAALENETAAVIRRAEAAAAAAEAVTDRSRFLVEGSSGDILVLFNDTAGAPSVVKTLSGGIKFVQGVPAACTPHRPIEDVYLNRELRDRLRPAGIEDDVSVARCSGDILRTYDLVLFQRGLLLGESVETLASILREVVAGRLSLLATISADQLLAARTAEVRRSADIEEDLAAGRIEGFGIILVPNSSKTVCRVLKDDVRRHEPALAPIARLIRDDFKDAPRWTDATEDAAFVALRRGQCGGVYAAASDLQRIKVALERDQVRSKLLPVWVEPAALGTTPLPPSVLPPSSNLIPESPPPVAASEPARDAETKQRRVALVIGNGAYTGLPGLPNPANDANDMSAALATLGFEVILSVNAGKAEMEDKLATFSKAARSADVALAFFAGHGLQYQGINYLAPVDAVLADETDLRRRFIKVQDLIEELESPQKRGARILLLDACRDNEAVTKLAAALPRSRSGLVRKGLASVEAPNGILIAFATQPNAVAADGEGRNSPFVQAMLRHLPTRGLEVRTLFTRVRSDVLKLTDQKQRPELSDSLDGEFAFH